MSESLAPVISECGYTYSDTVALSATDSDIAETSGKYWQEHLHPDPEVRLITKGSGIFEFRHAGRYAKESGVRGRIDFRARVQSLLLNSIPTTGGSESLQKPGTLLASLRGCITGECLIGG